MYALWSLHHLLNESKVGISKKQSAFQAEHWLLTCRRSVSPPSLLCHLSPLFLKPSRSCFECKVRKEPAFSALWEGGRSQWHIATKEIAKAISVLDKVCVCCFPSGTILVVEGVWVISIRTLCSHTKALFWEIYSESMGLHPLSIRVAICSSQELPLTTQKPDAIKVSACGRRE